MRTLITLTAGLGLTLAPVVLAQEPPRYDLVLSKGQVIDGSGNPWFRAEVAVRDGRIVRVGALDHGYTAEREVDARDQGDLTWALPGELITLDQKNTPPVS